MILLGKYVMNAKPRMLILLRSQGVSTRDSVKTAEF